MESSLASFETGNRVERAQRFAVPLSMLYRIKFDKSWHQGEVVNMSSTGVLFHGDFVIRSGGQIEVSINLPSMKNARGAARIVGHGIIVRSFGTESPDSGALLAAQLTNPRILRP